MTFQQPIVFSSQRLEISFILHLHHKCTFQNLQKRRRGTDEKIISENGFALLISDKEKLSATHSMFLLNENEESFYLETHISKANFQAKVLNDGDEVLCDFLGAHSYISSSWYDHQNVSTWNYEAVQIHGKVKLMNDDELYEHLRKLTFKYEKPQKCPMLVENMGDEYVKNEMKGAFESIFFLRKYSLSIN